ncbi:hypothetical protein NYF23_10380 [SAR92 clade bacterium H455]|uniref:Integral membrane protein n=1 Tax=SAR92 clade bacterium H455 TaxID=2974818 RepID=A0ABY5TKP6_9GAMM|nr:hypothetical protein NYF23_10380 [SAR92 clade bacterium H455]
MNTVLSIIFLLVSLGLLCQPLVNRFARRVLSMPSWRPFVWLNLAIGIGLVIWTISVPGWGQKIEWIVVFIIGASAIIKGLGLWVFPEWSRSLMENFLARYWLFVLPLSLFYFALAVFLFCLG